MSNIKVEEIYPMLNGFCTEKPEESIKETKETIRMFNDWRNYVIGEIHKIKNFILSQPLEFEKFLKKEFEKRMKEDVVKTHEIDQKSTIELNPIEEKDRGELSFEYELQMLKEFGSLPVRNLYYCFTQDFYVFIKNPLAWKENLDPKQEKEDNNTIPIPDIPGCRSSIAPIAEFNLTFANMLIDDFISKHVEEYRRKFDDWILINQIILGLNKKLKDYLLRSKFSFLQKNLTENDYDLRSISRIFIPEDIYNFDLENYKFGKELLFNLVEFLDKITEGFPIFRFISSLLIKIEDNQIFINDLKIIHFYLPLLIRVAMQLKASGNQIYTVNNVQNKISKLFLILINENYKSCKPMLDQWNFQTDKNLKEIFDLIKNVGHLINQSNSLTVVTKSKKLFETHFLQDKHNKLIAFTQESQKSYNFCLSMFNFLKYVHDTLFSLDSYISQNTVIENALSFLKKDRVYCYLIQRFEQIKSLTSKFEILNEENPDGFTFDKLGIKNINAINGIFDFLIDFFGPSKIFSSVQTKLEFASRGIKEERKICIVM